MQWRPQTHRALVMSKRTYSRQVARAHYLPRNTTSAVGAIRREGERLCAAMATTKHNSGVLFKNTRKGAS
jgi:hypothetical protein